MLFAHQPQSLKALRTLARAVTIDVPGLTMEVCMTAIPSALASEPGAGRLFDRGWMLRLEQLGYDRARGDQPWDEIVSPFTRPARLR